MSAPSASPLASALTSASERSADEIAGAVHQAAGRIVENVERVIVGKREAVELIVVALLCEGHVLLEDVPGVGKTLLAKAVAKSVDGSFRRIQFTPDLLPSDVTGLNIFDRKADEFRFQPGPVMANVVLADEINRATPRTQSSLLEAMEERQVTIDGDTKLLPRPFLVLATQNPVEQEGTFPLPEAQRDRFLMTVRPGYPSAEDEEKILLRFERRNPVDTLVPAISAGDLTALQEMCREIPMSDAVRGYVVQLVRATRDHPGIRLGASPRATQSLYRSAQALAAMQGRAYVLPDDVKMMAAPVLAHRLVVDTDARLGGRTAEALIEAITDRVPVPTE
jgi:MoxR-like ATPase